MSHIDGADSNEIIEGTNSTNPVRDDTLNMRRLDPTYERFVLEKRSPKKEEQAGASTAMAHSHGNSPIETEQPDFKFGLETPMLRDFTNPFDASPNEKSLADDISPPFKSPLKTPLSRRNTQESSERSRLLNLIASPVTAADKFRALKELQKIGGADIYDTLDYSNAGLVIETRKQDGDDGGDTDTNDDSGVQVNLIPTMRKPSQHEEESLESNAPTQPDGDFHQVANQISKNLRIKSSKTADPQDDDDDAYYLIHDERHNFCTHQEEDDVSRPEDMGALAPEVDSIADDMRSSVRSSPQTNNTKSKNSQSHTKTLCQENILTSPTSVRDDDNKLFTASTQNISESDNENIMPLGGSSKSAIERLGIKETQRIDNFSQSFVDENTDKFDSTQLSVILDDEDEGADEDGEVIKNGRNILGTFRIEESQPEKSFISASQNDDPDLFLSETSQHLPLSGNTKLDIPDTQRIGDDEEQNLRTQTNVPETEISSPIKRIHTSEEGANQDKTQAEVPNTSMVSISKIDINMNNGTDGLSIPLNADNVQGEDMTSTPIACSRMSSMKSSDANAKKAGSSPKTSRLTSRLNDVLLEEPILTANKTSADLSGLVRHKPSTGYRITDILDFTSIFYSVGTQKKPAYIVNVYEHDNDIVFGVKASREEDEILINKNKLFAPICIDIGSTVKCELNKRYNYIVIDLKYEESSASGAPGSQATQEGLRTIDGYNKVLLKKSSKTSSDEIEVSLKDIYLTNVSTAKYAYRLFDNMDDFNKYVDYNLQKFRMMKADEANNPNDTLSSMFLKSNNREPNFRSASFIQGKSSGCFSRCLFLLTALSNPPTSAGSISNLPSTRIADSRTNTPRRNKNNDEMSSLIAFITCEGGTVVEQDAFDNLIRFKTIADQRRKPIKTSPRKAKNILIQNNASKVNGDFKDYICTKDKGHYFACNFVETCQYSGEDVIEMIDEYKSFDFACVLSTRHGRTLKYLECLCLKWPIIHVDFIKMCMEDEYMKRSWKSLWTKFMLVSGESKVLNCITSLDIFGFYGKWKCGHKLQEQIRNNNSLKELKILIINDTFDQFSNRLKLGQYTIQNEQGGEKKRQKKHKKSGNKRRKIGVGTDDDDSSEEESSEDDTSLDGEDEGADGPNRIETLIWIYKILGSDCCYVPKPHGSISTCLKDILVDEQDTKLFIYFRCGGNENIDKFKRLILQYYGEGLAHRCVNWEWMVQSIICGIPL